MSRLTDQERFWKGDFGAEYVDRNQGPRKLAANIALFTELMRGTAEVTSVLELGPNIGLNLQAIAALFPDAQLSGVEINEQAAAVLRKELPAADVHVGSILDFQPSRTWDLVFTKGVMIHLAPEALPGVYDLMVRAANRYVAICEYYNPVPVEVPYRGHEGKLFKRDFAGEMLDAHAELRLVNYGFVYHRDPNYPQDDMTWFLFEKQA